MLLDDHIVGQDVLHLRDAGVELTLLVLGLVVLTVLGQVAEGAGLLDLVGDLLLPDGLQIVELLLELCLLYTSTSLRMGRLP